MTSGVPGPNPAGANIAPVSHVDFDNYWHRYDGVPKRSQVTELAHAATDIGRGFGGLTKDLAELSLPDAHTGKPREIFNRTGVNLHHAVADLRHAKSIGDEDEANRVLDEIVQQLSGDGFETSNETRDLLRPRLERAAEIEDAESNGRNAPLTLHHSVEDYYALRGRAEDAKEFYKHRGRLRRAAVCAGRAVKNLVTLPGTVGNWVGAQVYVHMPQSKEAPADPERRKQVRRVARVGGFLAVATGTYFAHKSGMLDPLYDVAGQAWDTVSEVAVDGYEAVEEWENVSEWVEGWFDDEPTAESGGNSGSESTSGAQQSETPTPESQPQQSETPAPDPSESGSSSTEPEQPQSEEPATGGSDSGGGNNTPPPAPEEAKPITIADFETAQLGTYDGSTNDHTGYLNGTGYNSIAESLMQQSSQLGLDIDINELRAMDPAAFEDRYYDFVEGVLKDNGLTWQEARGMFGTDTLTVKGERVTEYLTQSGIAIPQEIVQDPQLPQGGSGDTGTGSGDSSKADGGAGTQEDTGAGSTEEESGTGGTIDDGNGESADSSTEQDGQQGEQTEEPQVAANTETTESGVPLPVIIGASAAGAVLLGVGGVAAVRRRKRKASRTSGPGRTRGPAGSTTRTAPPPPPPPAPQPLPLPVRPPAQPPQGPPPGPPGYDPNSLPGGPILPGGRRRSPGYDPDDDDDNNPPRYS